MSTAENVENFFPQGHTSLAASAAAASVNRWFALNIMLDYVLGSVSALSALVCGGFDAAA